MSSPYLPVWATAQEASDWLQAETGQQWPLSRLLETARKMSVWIDCHDDEPEHIVEHVFQGRREGFRAAVTFGSDIARLVFVRDGGTLHITRRPDGTLLKITPPMRFAIEELRFEAACLKRVAALSATPVLASNETSCATPAIGPRADARTESKVQRQDRRFDACIAAGLQMPDSACGRLPDGVGRVAAAEGVTRQAFSDDVKAAMQRRDAKRREGVTSHLIK